MGRGGSVAIGKQRPARRAWKWLISFVLLIGLGVWVQHALGWEQVLLPWVTIPLRTVTLAFLLVLLSHLARGARVYEQYSSRQRFAFLPLLRLATIHTAINNLLPMRLGELSFPLLMKRYYGEGFADSGLTLIWIRLLDLHFLAWVFLIMLALRFGGWTWMVPVVWLLGLALIYFVREQLAIRIGDRSGRLASLARLALAQVPVRFSQHLLCYVWTAVSWSAKVSAFTLILLHFIDLPPWHAVTGVIGGELSSILPVHGIAGAGSYEAAVVLALLPLNVSQGQALTGAVNLHVFLLGSTSVLGLLALFLPVPRRSLKGVEAGPYN